MKAAGPKETTSPPPNRCVSWLPSVGSLAQSILAKVFLGELAP